MIAEKLLACATPVAAPDPRNTLRWRLPTAQLVARQKRLLASESLGMVGLS